MVPSSPAGATEKRMLATQQGGQGGGGHGRGRGGKGGTEEEEGAWRRKGIGEITSYA
ncbi:hypothetical protein ACP70R_032578 [Stipagrostis hirtigluma subsp. patula]